MLKTFASFKASSQYFQKQPLGHAVLKGKHVELLKFGGVVGKEASQFGRGYVNCSKKLVEYHDLTKHRSHRRAALQNST